MDFLAEIKRTSQSKQVSNDNVYEITFRTENPQILDLGKLKPDTIVEVSVTLHNTNEQTSNEAKAKNVGI